MPLAEHEPARARPVGQRRERRRRQTLEEIKAVAIEVMAESGVAGLALAEVARRMGMRPPSLYKYFPSRMALYHEVFKDGHTEYLEVFRAAAAAAGSGWPALVAGLEAGGRWVMEHQAVAQLLFLRPVPGFEPTEAAFAPSRAMVENVRSRLGEAVTAGQLRPAAACDDGVAMLSTLVAGVMSQQLANQPDASFDAGRYTRLAPRLMEMFAQAFAPQGGE